MPIEIEVIYYPDGTTETKQREIPEMPAPPVPTKSELMAKVEELLQAVNALK